MAFKKLLKKLRAKRAKKRLEKVTKAGGVRDVRQTSKGEIKQSGTFKKPVITHQNVDTQYVGDVPAHEKSGRIRKDVVAAQVTEKGGYFPEYQKGSKSSKSFSSAFGKASKAGKKTFMWDGRKYTTKKKK